MFTDTTTAYLSSIVADSTPKAKPLAKSLHTVTVLVNVARFIRVQPFSSELTTAQCVDYAARILELEAPDHYGLKEQALKKLSKG